MSVWHRQIEGWRVPTFRGSVLSTRRQIMLHLKPEPGESVNRVSITFEPSPPSNFIGVDSDLMTVRLALGDYGDMVHLLQTGGPLYFTAYEAGSPPVRFAGLSTAPGDAEGSAGEPKSAPG